LRLQPSDLEEEKSAKTETPEPKEELGRRLVYELIYGIFEARAAMGRVSGIML
jgi:hypothetical protein